jgi:hypothetical protein
MKNPLEHRNEQGELLGLRVIELDGTSYGGFQNPTEVGETVEAKDWSDTLECGGGIHFWPWGFGRQGKSPNNKMWQVIKITGDYVGWEGSLDGKAKCEKAELLYSGNQAQAEALLFEERLKMIFAASKGSASASGDSGSASASGYCGSASASGRSGSASASGYRGSASASGHSLIATCSGLNSKARTIENGVIVLTYYDGEKNVAKAAHCPQDIKPNIWYKLNENGEFYEC